MDSSWPENYALLCVCMCQPMKQKLREANGITPHFPTGWGSAGSPSLAAAASRLAKVMGLGTHIQGAYNMAVVYWRC